MTNAYAAVKALIMHDEKYLVIEQECKGKKYVDIPGGKVADGESPYDTLVREVDEEVGLKVEIGNPLGMYWFIRDMDGIQVVCTTFLCTTKNNEIDFSHNPSQSEKVLHHCWLSKEDLLGLDQLIDESLRNVFVSL